jgi:NADPH-dependent glutamate synthase beta subunit-like oxidoreductase
MISDINIKVNRELCYACGICVDRCIMDNLRLSVAPCRQECPLHMNCQGYVRLIAQGRLEEAGREMYAYTPFGGILGRVCSHPCEATCERGKMDGAVHIRALKRYLADAFAVIHPDAMETASETDRRVAVIGSGPAGLNAAYDVRRQGHSVTVYEAESTPGGLLRYAIPSFRLPIEQVDRAIRTLTEMGICFETGQALGRDLDLNQMREAFDAVILALGAGPGRELAIPGHHLDGVISGLDLLRRVKTGKMTDPGGSVVVVGGGNTAVDAALTCRRLGIEDVSLVCLENRDEMPAFDLEVEETLEDGIQVLDGWGPLKMEHTRDNRIRLELARCRSLFDGEGRFCPCLESECGRSLEAETVVVAVGQRFDPRGLPSNLIDVESGRLAADPVTLQSKVMGNVFVCGDAYTGPSSVVEAMASGREAAFSVNRLLADEGLRWGRGFWNGASIETYEVDPGRAKGGPRGRLPRLPLAERRLDTEVEHSMSAEEAKREAERCLSCGRAAEINQTCWYCLPCEIECPVGAIEVRMPYLVR